MKLYQIAFILLFVLTAGPSCKKAPDIDCEGVTPTWDADIKAISDKACAYSGCHVSGFNRGNLSTYAGMKASADNGSLEKKVVNNQSMPKKSGSGPDELTEEEIRLFKCWIDNGAPEL